MKLQRLARQLVPFEMLWRKAAGGPGLAAIAREGTSLATAAIVLPMFVGLEWLSFLHEHNGMPVTPWNPGLGVMFGLLLLRGPGLAILLFVGVVAAEIAVLQSELAWPVIVVMAGIIAVSFAVAAAVARPRLDPSVSRVRDILTLLAAGAIASAVSAISIGALLLFSGELEVGDLAEAAVPLLVGDIIGIAVTTPLVLRLLARWRDIRIQSIRALLPEIALHLCAVVAILWTIVGADAPNSYKYFPLLFLPVVAAALRHGVDGSCLSLAVIQFGLVALMRLLGFDATAFTEFQVVMLALTTSGLLTGVVVSERQRADTAAREAEARFREMQAESARAARLNMVSGMASALAHEINQPMTAARALARAAQQLIRAPAADIPRAEANLDALIGQVDHASGVVRRMREFLRRGQPRSSSLEMRSVIEDALLLAWPDAAAKGVSLDTQIAERLPTCFGDRVQLQQVVLNLVRNAVEAIAGSNQKDGRVRVAVRCNAEVSVLDNGPGMDTDFPLFEPFAPSSKEGLGLGLSICASIMHAHGGRIWLHTRQAGAMEFRFSLPVQPDRTAS